MKKLILVPCLFALFACDTPSQQAAQDCSRLDYKPGTTEYEHCKIDMKKAEEMESKSKQMKHDMMH